MARRKFNVGDKVVGNEKKPSFRDRKGTIVGCESGSQYWVVFDDSRKECVYSWWLDKRNQDSIADHLTETMSPQTHSLGDASHERESQTNQESDSPYPD